MYALTNCVKQVAHADACGGQNAVKYGFLGENVVSQLADFFREEPLAVVAETLDFFLNECTVDEAPTVEEVAVWEGIFMQRGGKFVNLAVCCRDWLAQA